MGPGPADVMASGVNIETPASVATDKNTETDEKKGKHGVRVLQREGERERACTTTYLSVFIINTKCHYF